MKGVGPLLILILGQVWLTKGIKSPVGLGKGLGCGPEGARNSMSPSNIRESIVFSMENSKKNYLVNTADIKKNIRTYADITEVYNSNAFDKKKSDKAFRYQLGRIIW